MRPTLQAEQYTTIGQLPAGAHGIVQALLGGHQFIGRLASLGFTVGADVEVRQNCGYGPVLVRVRDTLIALGRAEAARVTVWNRG